MTTCRRSISALAVSLGLLVGCSASDTGPQAAKECNPPCLAGQLCDRNSGTCVAAPACTPGQPCGSNAICSATGSCGCQPGWLDCNSDLGQAAGNGCECDSQCNGLACGAVGGQCSADVAHACNSFSSFCDVTTQACQSCANGSYNCDGVGPCESQQACGGSGPCDSANEDACPGEGFYCDGPSKSCAACPPGSFNCDGVGDCESQQACASKPTCVVNYQDGCGGDNDFCDALDKTCKPCQAGTFNCDGTGICECDFQCAGDICEDLSKMSCADLEIAYGNLVNEALVCDPAITAPQCTERTFGGVKCRCEVFANASKGDALRKMKQILATFDAAGCKQSCPPIANCANPTSSTCKDFGGKARCN